MKTRRTKSQEDEIIDEGNQQEEVAESVANKGSNKKKNGQESSSLRTTSSKKKATRQQRKEQRNQLKSKATGVGLVIPSSSTTVTTTASSSTSPAIGEKRLNRKIVFGEDDEFDDDANNEGNDDAPEKSMNDNEGQGSSNDEDDDAVEEMTSNVAKAKVMEQRAQERAGHRLATVGRTTRKKRKATKESAAMEDDEDQSHDNDDIDDDDVDFFAQIDSIRQQDKIKSKQKGKSAKHTVFLHQHDKSDDGNGDTTSIPTLINPKQMDQNIQIVVLPDASSNATSGASRLSAAVSGVTKNATRTTASSLFAVPTSTNASTDLLSPSMSNDVLTYSRSQLSQGPLVNEKMAKGNIRANNNKKRKAGKNDEGAVTWKRSKQMNFLSAGGRNRTKKTGGFGPRRGMAAPHFAINSKNRKNVN